MSEIHVKAGTLVNGLSIEGHKAMQVKIANLTMENDKLKAEIAELETFKNIMTKPTLTPREKLQAQNAIPDWIAPGKWIETPTQIVRIKTVKGVDIKCYSNTIPKSYTLDWLLKNAKPFTPPPCPELPYGITQSSGIDLIFGGYNFSIEALIEVTRIDKDKWSHGAHETLKEFRDWREKWGDV